MAGRRPASSPARQTCGEDRRRTSVSSQRTIVVVPSRGLEGDQAARPRTCPRGGSRSASAARSSVIVDRVVDGQPDDPDRRRRPRPDPDRRRRRAAGRPSSRASSAAGPRRRRGPPRRARSARRRRSASGTAGLGPWPARARTRSTSQARPTPSETEPDDDPGSRRQRAPERHPRRPSLDRALAVAGLQIDGRDGIGEDGRVEAEASGVERRRLDAVVGGEADDDDALDAARREGVASSSVGIGLAGAGSRIVKPE